ncbi:hypothetical protein B0H13DRAFT_2661537 [Mycena leptocephala]|nr:hypothetical protein B0H13DRAFT_2661537 [Mycena leptocephala]
MGTQTIPQLGSTAILSKSKPLKSQSSDHSCAASRCVPQVPQEIIDAIINNVDSEDMASFKACSLVCWAFVPASRTHIFRTISLAMLNDAPHKLYAMLQRSPHIVLYVRDLEIHRSHDPNLWMQPSSPLVTVLSMLSHLEQFSIFGYWGDWLNVPSSLALGILRVISLASLERLHILNVTNMPAVLLHSALSLRVLSLYYVSMNPYEDPCSLHLPQNPRRAASLQFLNVSLDSKVGKILEHLQALGSTHFTNVRRLAVNPIPNSINSSQNFARFLTVVENTLERLDIQWHEFSFNQFDASGVDTSRLRLLRTVQLHLIMEEPDVTVPKYLPRAIHQLCLTNPLLESITFVLHIPNVATAEIPAASSVARRLRKLDADLGKDGAALREAHWKIIPECSPPSVVPDYAAFFQNHLCRTRSRGILSVEQGYRMRGAAILPWLPYRNV